MRLRVIEPADTVVDVETTAISAPGVHGSFTLLPRHVDYVAGLVEGIVTYWVTPEGDARRLPEAERYVAVDGGVLVKRGLEVTVSTPNAVHSDRLEDLEQSVSGLFRATSERDADARAVLFRMETDLVQRMLELEDGRG